MVQDLIEFSKTSPIIINVHEKLNKMRTYEVRVNIVRKNKITYRMTEKNKENLKELM